MTQKKSPDDHKREALTVLVQWRGADRAHVADKGNQDLAKLEYKCRKDLRTAADNLDEVQHG